MAGVFVKCLAGKFRATVAHVNDLGVAALLFDGRDPIELLRFLGALKTVPVGSESNQKSRSHRWACGREAAEEGRVGMGIGGLLDPLFQFVDGLMQGLEHSGQRLSFERGRLD